MKHVQVLSLLNFTFQLLLLLQHATSHNIINSIPAFHGNLPFYLETGYVSVGKDEEVELFYYFVKSESNYSKDPLMLWLTGGPGCSAFSGLVLEIGPLNFNTSACNWHSKWPTFQINPYSWTKVASIIFLDSPVGTGFSYSTNEEGYYTNDNIASRDIYQFLTKWLVDHAEFQNNPLYITGDSYSGKIVPIVVQEIFDGNKAGFQPFMNLKGYVLGNPFTWTRDDSEDKYEYGRRVSLLSNELYQSMIESCNGLYDDDDDMENVSCKDNLQAVSNSLDPLFTGHILRPKCISNETWCQESMYQLLKYWANDIKVQEALHVRQGTKPYWIRCNITLAYDVNVESVVGYHQNHMQKFMHALIYSGDQDLYVSYVGTLGWIRMLNISITEEWRPWFVNGQVAGYTTKYSNGRYNLTFSTVRGAGHTAAEYRRPECFAMLNKWFARLSL